MSKWLNSLQPFGALFLRLALGVSMAVHGYEKVIPHGALNHYVPLHRLARHSLLARLRLGLHRVRRRHPADPRPAHPLRRRPDRHQHARRLLLVGIHQGFGIYNYILALAALAIMLTFYGAGALALDRKIGFA